MARRFCTRPHAGTWVSRQVGLLSLHHSSGLVHVCPRVRVKRGPDPFPKGFAMKKTLLAAAALTGLLAGTSARAAVTQAPVSTDGQKSISTQQKTQDAGSRPRPSPTTPTRASTTARARTPARARAAARPTRTTAKARTPARARAAARPTSRLNRLLLLLHPTFRRDPVAASHRAAGLRLIVYSASSAVTDSISPTEARRRREERG